MYFFKPNQRGVDGAELKAIEIPSPSEAAGLYVKTRDGRTLKVAIPCVSPSLNLARFPDIVVAQSKFDGIPNR